MKIVAIVPIKMNNERLPGKNTKLLNGKPLIHYVLKTLDQIDDISESYVYCSSDKISEYLIGKSKYLNRPQSLDMKTSNFTQIFESFMKKIDADIYIYAHATAPFISVETVQECIDAVKNDNYDSAFCAVKIQDYLWKDGEPMNFDATNIPRSQDLQPIYRETSGVYVFKKSVFEKYRRRIGKKPFIKEVSFKESVDINNPEDFELAKYMEGYSKEEKL